MVSGQSEVDRVLARAASPSAPLALPKGMSLETAGVVERILRSTNATLSAAECAAKIGISRVSARRYLEHFSATGRVEVSLRYGAAGRPERRYRWLD
jgi:response regulator of citrate/malate metabolism